MSPGLWLSGCFTCRQLRPSSRREHVRASQLDLIDCDIIGHLTVLVSAINVPDALTVNSS